MAQLMDMLQLLLTIKARIPPVQTSTEDGAATGTGYGGEATTVFPAYDVEAEGLFVFLSAFSASS